MPHMQRRHFETIAAAVKATRERSTIDRDSLLAFVATLADELQKTNANFRRDQFLVACGFTTATGESTYRRRRVRRPNLYAVARGAT
jgi:hypothetical protein